MPRSKAAPSRKRERDDDQVSATDLATAAALVESAEVDGYESRISAGTCKLHTRGDAAPSGLVRLELADDVLAPIRALHTTICDKLSGTLTGWGGIGDASGRRRGYGYLAASKLGAAHYESSHAMRE